MNYKCSYCYVLFFFFELVTHVNCRVGRGLFMKDVCTKFSFVDFCKVNLAMSTPNTCSCLHSVQAIMFQCNVFYDRQMAEHC